MVPAKLQALLCLGLLACSPEQGISSSPAAAPDATPGAGGEENDPPNDGGDESCQPPENAAPTPLGRGLSWVRENPTFISGLTVRMGAPPSDFVHAYFDDFEATAIHLWTVGLPNAMNAWRAVRPGARWLSWLRNDGTSWDGQQLMGGYAANTPGRIGYQIGDEPRTLADINEMAEGVAAVRAADPNGLIILNYSYSADELDKIMARAKTIDYDIISFDLYSGSRSVYGTLNYYRKIALEEGKPYWAYLNSYVDGDSHNWHPTESDMRWNAFSHAAYGYTGFSWFLYQIPAPAPSDHEQLRASLFEQTGSFQTNPSPRFAIAAQVNRELLNLSRSISQLTSTDVRYIAVSALAQPKGTEAWSEGAGGDSYITAVEPGSALGELVVTFFDDDHGDTYVMLVNGNHENGKFPVDNDDAQNVSIDFDFTDADGCLDITKLRVMDKVTGAIVDRPLQSTGDRTARLEVELPAGDAIFFKYANQVPFAKAAW